MTTPFQQLARRIVRLETAVRAGRTPQLANSSLENAGINEYDDSGQLSAVLGRQVDGTHGAVTFSGPVPPTPSAPQVESVLNGIRIVWDGEWAPVEGDSSLAPTPVAVPLDFSRVEVHVGTSPLGLGLLAPRTTIETPRGGEVIVAVSYETDYYVRFVCRAASGKVSLVSEPAGPVRAYKATAEDLDVDLAALSGTTVFYGPDEPETDKADLWLKTPTEPDGSYTALRYDVEAGEWRDLQDAGVVEALLQVELAQTTADSKVQVFAQAEQPPTAGRTEGDIWIETDNDNLQRTWSGEAWVARRIGNSAVKPASLVASTVVVTGSISASLLEAVMVLATIIISGDPDGDHARMTPTGFRVYRASQFDGGAPEEVVRMGTDTNDYFGVVNSAGDLVASVDDTGRATFSNLNVNDSVSIRGVPLERTLETFGGRIVGRWTGPIYNLEGQSGQGIRGEYGIAQFTFPCEEGRAYLINLNGPTWYFAYGGSNNGGGEAYIRIRQEPNNPATLSSQMLYEWPFQHPKDGQQNRAGQVVEWTAGYTGVANIGVSMNLLYPAQSLSSIRIPHGSYISMVAYDMGPAGPGTAGNQSGMGGQLYQGPPPPPPPPATQQYYVDLAPVGRRTWRGNGSVFDGGADVYQGYNQYGNGDMRGMFWFDLPVITGTVDRVDVYTWSRHWHYNSGGTAIMNFTDNRGEYPDFYKFANDWYIPGYPKGGAKVVTLPYEWGVWFRGTNNASRNGRVTAVSFGPGQGTNLNYYGVFTDCRLNIWYTQ